MSTVFRAAYLSLTDDDIDEDTAGFIGFLDAQPQVQPGPIGSIGFCMSGRFVTTAARSFPDHFACAASLYGTRLVTDERGNGLDDPSSLVDLDPPKQVNGVDAAPGQRNSLIRRPNISPLRTHSLQDFLGMRAMNRERELANIYCYGKSHQGTSRI